MIRALFSNRYIRHAFYDVIAEAEKQGIEYGTDIGKHQERNRLLHFIKTHKEQGACLTVDDILEDLILADKHEMNQLLREKGL
jgi:hypothetical protein